MRDLRGFMQRHRQSLIGRNERGTTGCGRCRHSTRWLTGRRLLLPRVLVTQALEGFRRGFQLFLQQQVRI
jgi:hypothetical protein